MYIMLLSTTTLTHNLSIIEHEGFNLGLIMFSESDLIITFTLYCL